MAKLFKLVYYFELRTQTLRSAHRIVEVSQQQVWEPIAFIVLYQPEISKKGVFQCQKCVKLKSENPRKFSFTLKFGVHNSYVITQ